MTGVVLPWVVAAASVSLIILGDWLLMELGRERRSLAGTLLTKEVLWASLLYAGGAPLWAYVIQVKNDLTLIGIMYSGLTLLGLVALGVLVYGEAVSWYRISAVGLALAAIVLMELEPANAGKDYHTHLELSTPKDRSVQDNGAKLSARFDE